MADWVRNGLINLYANNAIEAVEDDAQLIIDALNAAAPDGTAPITGITDLLNLPDYTPLNQQITDAKAELERSGFHDNTLTTDQKRYTVLELMYKHNRRSEDVDNSLHKNRIYLFRDVALAAFAQQGLWTEAQQQHFEALSEKFAEHRILFISYTNKPDDPIHVYENYNHIYDRLPRNERDEDIREQRNQLPLYLSKRFKSMNMHNVFYDKKVLRVGDEWESIIRKECLNAFTLVQIITPQALTWSENSNWVFKEWEIFNNQPETAGIPRNRYFMLCYLANLNDADFDYPQWVQDMQAIQYITMKNDATTMEGYIRNIRTQVDEFIRNNIIRAL